MPERILPSNGCAPRAWRCSSDDLAPAAKLRNDRIRAVTGIEFRPLDESIRDCVESLLSVAKVKAKLREGYSLRA